MLSAWSRKKPLLALAVVMVLVGAAAFFALPLLIGSSKAVGYPIDPADHISSWSWQGAYADGGAKEDETNKEIASLKGGIGDKGASAYDTYVGIASEYELLGDGKNAYRYLSKAIALKPSRGIAYLNMGHLMEELGALVTARGAYDQAVAAELDNELFRSARSNFLIQHPAK